MEDGTRSLARTFSLESAALHMAARGYQQRIRLADAFDEALFGGDKKNYTPQMVRDVTVCRELIDVAAASLIRAHVLFEDSPQKGDAERLQEQSSGLLKTEEVCDEMTRIVDLKAKGERAEDPTGCMRLPDNPVDPKLAWNLATCSIVAALAEAQQHTLRRMQILANGTLIGSRGISEDPIQDGVRESASRYHDLGTLIDEANGSCMLLTPGFGMKQG